MYIDLHTHSSLSDGIHTILEMGQRAKLNGCSGIGMADHVGDGILLRVIEEARRDCAILEEEYGLTAIPGVEITGVPPRRIDELARKARQAGARLVIVHGESIREPIEPGTNRAAVESDFVDILAHPGLISPEEVEIAAAKGIFLELSARKGHCLGNGRVAALAREKGARLLINSDAHASGEILSEDMARKVGLGAGLTLPELEESLYINPGKLLRR